MKNALKLTDNKQNYGSFYFDLKNILVELLPLLGKDVINITIGYLSPFPFLNLALTNFPTFSQICKFLHPADLIAFSFLNKYLNSINTQIIYSHYLPAHSSSSQIIKEIQAQQLINSLESNLIYYIQKGPIIDLIFLIKANILKINTEILDQSLIVHAVLAENIRFLNYLLEHKAEIKKVKGLKEYDLEDHENLLTLAFKKGCLKSVKILLPYFEPIPIGLISKQSKSTLFMQAVENGDITLVKTLALSRAEEINPPDYSTLKSAIHQKNLEMTQFLLENGVSIESKTSDYSPLLHFVQRCESTIIMPDSETKFFQNITKMFDLLLQHGDKIEVVEPSYIKQLFLRQNHVLARSIILHGGKDDEINIFDIYLHINFIVKSSEQGNDWDTLIFWLTILMKKQPDFDVQYSSLLEGAANLFEGLIFFKLIDQNLTSEVCKNKIFHLTKALKVLTDYEAKNTQNWSTIKYFANDLYCAAHELILIKYNKFKELNSDHYSYNSDSDQPEMEDEKNSTGIPSIQNDSKQISPSSTEFGLFPLPPVVTNFNTDNSSTIESKNIK